MTKRTKARAVVEVAAAATAADPGPSWIAAPADRSAALVAGPGNCLASSFVGVEAETLSD